MRAVGVYGHDGLAAERGSVGGEVDGRQATDFQVDLISRFAEPLSRLEGGGIGFGGLGGDEDGLRRWRGRGSLGGTGGGKSGEGVQVVGEPEGRDGEGATQGQGQGVVTAAAAKGIWRLGVVYLEDDAVVVGDATGEPEIDLDVVTQGVLLLEGGYKF